MSPWKKFLRSDGLRAAACYLAAAYIRLVARTSRWRVEGGDIPASYWDQGKPFILAFWHGRLLMMPLVWRQGVEIRMLISRHRDGEFIARTIGHFGLGTVRGSSAKAGKSDKGGIEALRTMVRALKSGVCVGITPDGPKGPRMRASDGIAAVSRLAGVPIIPAVAATSRRKVLGSWDRFLIALPFSQGVLKWGAPLSATDFPDLESARVAIETAMNDLARAADVSVGQVPIEPAP